MLRRSFKPTNQIINGDFIKSFDSWVALGSNPTAGSSIDTTKYLYGVQSLNINVSVSGCNRCQDVVANTGDKIYVSGYVYKISGDGVSFYILAKDTGAGALLAFQSAITDQATDVWVKHSGVFTTVNTGYRVVIGRTSPQTYNCNFDGILTVNLTTLLTADLLALSDADLKAWCDLNIPAWFDGTMSSGSFGSIGGLK